jgi:hypothetical protein
VFAISLILLLALQQPPAFRAEVRVVRVDAEVRQEMRSIDGLARQDVLITDEGKPQEILYFGQIEEPLDRILLFDTSGPPRDSQDGDRQLRGRRVSSGR